MARAATEWKIGTQVRIVTEDCAWRLRVLDLRRHPSSVELAFENIDCDDAIVRLQVEASNLTYEHVAAMLRSHLAENRRTNEQPVSV